MRNHIGKTHKGKDSNMLIGKVTFQKDPLESCNNCESNFEFITRFILQNVYLLNQAIPR
jgi:hypothetical protein